jgi:hypothetical protein
MHLTHYRVTGGSRNVKLIQTNNFGHPLTQFGPFPADDVRRRSVLVFAMHEATAYNILDQWQSVHAVADHAEAIKGRRQATA